MVQARHRYSLSVILLAASLLAQSATSPQTSNALRTVSGRVVDDLTGEPLSGATVQLEVVVMYVNCSNCNPPLARHSEPEPPRTVVTGKDGVFTFDNVPRKNIEVRAKKPDYLDPWIRRRAGETFGMYGPDDVTDALIVRLAPAATISGVFRDHNGAVIKKGAGISLWRPSAWCGWPQLGYGGFAELGSDGTYHFSNLGPGRYYLVADPPIARGQGPAIDENGQAVGETPVRYPASRERSTALFTLREGQHEEIDFRFPEKKLHRVSGTIEEDQFYSYDMEDGDGSKAYLLTGSPFEKTFEAWLPTGSYRLSTGRDDVAGPLPFEVRDSDVADLHFAIRDPGRIEIPVEVTSAGPRKATCPDTEPVCGFFLVDMLRFQPGGYIEVVGDSTQTGKNEGTPPRRIESVSVIPGTYTAAIAVSGNVYAKSIMSGSTDFAEQPLVIRPGDSPEPIRIVLAEGAIVDGSVYQGGKPSRAWVYGVAEEIESKADFRVFQPVVSKEDGTFHMPGLAPGSYLFFASDIELPLNIHDPDEIDYWRSRGKIVRVEAGKTTNLVLNVATAPEVP